MTLFKSWLAWDGLLREFGEEIAKVLLRFGDLGKLEDTGREVFFLFKLEDA